ncbi:MAG TPA: hypothetical protein VEH84_04570 [Alphaproteobacteria bacterium]|nr:hypothetical protein [Alphaproteobacteria bacterium]
MSRPTASACGPLTLEEDDCRCRRAVTRAFRELRGCGQPDRTAYDAALAVFRWHHPEASVSEARETVAAWVWDGVAH